MNEILANWTKYEIEKRKRRFEADKSKGGVYADSFMDELKLMSDEEKYKLALQHGFTIEERYKQAYAPLVVIDTFVKIMKMIFGLMRDSKVQNMNKYSRMFNANVDKMQKDMYLTGDKRHEDFVETISGLWREEGGSRVLNNQHYQYCNALMNIGVKDSNVVDMIAWLYTLKDLLMESVSFINKVDDAVRIFYLTYMGTDIKNVAHSARFEIASIKMLKIIIGQFFNGAYRDIANDNIELGRKTIANQIYLFDALEKNAEYNAIKFAEMKGLSCSGYCKDCEDYKCKLLNIQIQKLKDAEWQV